MDSNAGTPARLYRDEALGLGLGGIGREEEYLMLRDPADVDDTTDTMLSSDTWVAANVTRGLKKLLESELPQVFNDPAVFVANPGNTTRRFKVAFQLAPGWGIPVTELQAHTTLLGGEWTCNTGYNWSDFARVVEFYSWKDAVNTRPFLYVRYNKTAI